MLPTRTSSAQEPILVKSRPRPFGDEQLTALYSSVYEMMRPAREAAEWRAEKERGWEMARQEKEAQKTREEARQRELEQTRWEVHQRENELGHEPFVERPRERIRVP
jgi:hypothetical protein